MLSSRLMQEIEQTPNVISTILVGQQANGDKTSCICGIITGSMREVPPLAFTVQSNVVDEDLVFHDRPRSFVQPFFGTARPPSHPLSLWSLSLSEGSNCVLLKQLNVTTLYKHTGTTGDGEIEDVVHSTLLRINLILKS